MAGTVKLCVPELVLGEEGVACGELGCVDAVAVTDGLAAAECLCVGVGDDPGVSLSADVGAAPGAVAEAADPLVTAADGTAEGDPLAPHAARPAPPMTTTMITAGTRHILMLQPSGG
jgi:hypothetical protein